MGWALSVIAEWHWAIRVMVILVIWAGVAAPWRPASGVLALGWLVAQAYFWATDESVPVPLYLNLDFIAIVALLTWRASWLDALVLGIFPVEIWVYFQVDDAVTQWWLLWALTAIQMILAGPWPVLIKALGTYSHGSVKAVTGACNGGH